MTAEKPYRSCARIVLPEAKAVVADVCRHMTEHDAEHVAEGGRDVLRFATATVCFLRQGEAVDVEIRAEDLESIYFARMAVASHVIEFTRGAPPEITWSGDGDDLARPPNFQLLEVVDIRQVTPCMRRLTLRGENVARFVPLDALHLNVLVQRPGLAAPQWPTVGADGLIRWADQAVRPWLRKYTVRHVDPARSTLDIDFVLHADAGPGSALAETARIGDPVGVMGPGGGGLVAADWYLLAGDETALPAIARMMEHLPDNVSGKALIEVADADEIQKLPERQGLTVEWLCRNGAPHPSTLLADRVSACAFPEDGRAIYVWVGCEYDAFRAIRYNLRTERGLKRDQHLAVAYWRRGHGEDA